LTLLRGGGKRIERKSLLERFSGFRVTRILLEFFALLEQRVNAIDRLSSLQALDSDFVTGRLLKGGFEGLLRFVFLALRQCALADEEILTDVLSERMFGLLQLELAGIKDFLRAGKVAVIEQLSPKSRRLKRRFLRPGREAARQLEIFDAKQDLVIALLGLALDLHIIAERIRVPLQCFEHEKRLREVVILH